MPRISTKASETDLDTKIGQMLMLGFRGFDVDENSAVMKDIKERRIGGVVLFDEDVTTNKGPRNIDSPEQLKHLTGKLQAASNIPLLIAIDQEGGKVARLKEKYGFPPTASASYYGHKNDTTLTHSDAVEIAATLKENGVNMNLAPVVDINVDKKSPAIGAIGRSFSPDGDVVATHALEFIKAHHENGVLTALKHFPGHGSAMADSHKGVTDVSATWSEKELFPYEKLIKAGAVDAVLTAHVFNKKLDPEYPATLSKATIGGYLRNKLHFDGVVISDDMQMGAVISQYGFEESIEKAIEAGVDIILIGNNLVYDEDAGKKAFAAIKGLVLSGKISKQRIDESYDRIVRMKETNLRHLNPPFPFPDKSP